MSFRKTRRCLTPWSPKARRFLPPGRSPRAAESFCYFARHIREAVHADAKQVQRIVASVRRAGDRDPISRLARRIDDARTHRIERVRQRDDLVAELLFQLALRVRQLRPDTAVGEIRE